MNAVDTSVVVAGIASWHRGHEGAAEVLARGARVYEALDIDFELIA